ncbi:MAG TPA: carbon monoxide dehydrogenase subunit G [Alphaproteobacteria bacterium]|nr:carbon monoxide dehydrogenase subunit G [Alphaproteobacteria bacterium]
MDMTGEYRIAAPRQRVWEALNDPEFLKQSIPGCESLERSGPDEFTAKVVAKVGPVKATFTGVVTLSDLDPPKSYKISGEGKGGAAGFARGGAEVALEEDSGATILRYKASANVGGKLAQIGSRLIDSTAKKLSDDFFGKFAELLSTGGAQPAPAPAEAAPTPVPAQGAPERPPQRQKGLSPAVWIGAVVIVIILLLIAFA